MGWVDAKPWQLGGCVVVTSLPEDVFLEAMTADAAQKQIDEEWNSQDRDCCVECRKVGARNAGVEAPQRPDPDEKDNVSLPGLQPVEAKRRDGQAEEEKDVEGAPESEGYGLG